MADKCDDELQGEKACEHVIKILEDLVLPGSFYRHHFGLHERDGKAQHDDDTEELLEFVRVMDSLCKDFDLLKQRFPVLLDKQSLRLLCLPVEMIHPPRELFWSDSELVLAALVVAVWLRQDIERLKLFLSDSDFELALVDLCHLVQRDPVDAVQYDSAT